MSNSGKNPLLSRDEFRNAVFSRDGHKCVFCDKPAVDAHHIIERRLWPDGGYYLNNGASVCEEHHLECEKTTISVEEVRLACGITTAIVPPHLYPDHQYDKWGNSILPNNTRTKGELFYDESVQKILGLGGVLPLFTDYVKYPRTHHLPWSPGVHDDDRVISDLEGFKGKQVVVTEKMDGENTSMYSDHIHARSVDSKGGEDRAWVKQFWSSICYDIPKGWRICGENMWSKHSISYDSLSSYFYGFSIWNDKNLCLSWDETLDYFDYFGIIPAKTLYEGIWNVDALHNIEKHLNTETQEGYVVRVKDSFSYKDFPSCIAKYVRKDHVKTTPHWRYGARIVKNKLK